MVAEIDLPKLIERFGSEDKCHAYLEDLRWPDGVRCPRCDSAKISRIAKRRQFDCDGCRYQFSVRVGTLFHDSKLPLWKWFLAVYMMGESKKGVSANQLKRMLGVSYKTAWYLCHRIRAAMKDGGAELLRGVIEADETFVGGKLRFPAGTSRSDMARHRRDNKTVVLGAVSRGGEVRLRIAPDATRESIHGFLKDVVADDGVPVSPSAPSSSLSAGIPEVFRNNVKDDSTGIATPTGPPGWIRTNDLPFTKRVLSRIEPGQDRHCPLSYEGKGPG